MNKKTICVYCKKKMIKPRPHYALGMHYLCYMNKYYRDVRDGRREVNRSIYKSENESKKLMREVTGRAA